MKGVQIDQVITLTARSHQLAFFFFCACRWRIICWSSLEPQRKGQQQQGGLLLSTEEGTTLVPFQLSAGFLRLSSGEMLFPKKIETTSYSEGCEVSLINLLQRNLIS